MSSTQGGRKAGTIGDCGILSFYATKNIVTGEGGMVLTGDDEVAARIKVLCLQCPIRVPSFPNCPLKKGAHGARADKGAWFCLQCPIRAALSRLRSPASSRRRRRASSCSGEGGGFRASRASINS